MLHDLVHDALVLTEAGLSKREIRVQVSVPATLPRIAGDRTRLLQVLVNLLKNAMESFDHGDGGGRERRIDIRGWFQARRVWLQIRDSGRGFEPDRADSLLARGVSGKPGGCGLGLYTSRKTITAHQGAMSIESAGPGRGATVTIELPGNPEQGEEPCSRS